jgi:hypothetical protein
MQAGCMAGKQYAWQHKMSVYFDTGMHSGDQGRQGKLPKAAMGLASVLKGYLRCYVP